MPVISPQGRGLGWNPDRPDHRDLYYSAPLQSVPLPDKIDLRPQMPAVYDQESIGSCTANAIAGSIEFERMKQGLDKDPAPGKTTPSRLMIYFLEREMEGNIDNDSGAFIRDGIKSVAKIGTCFEDLWPYDISKFTQKPPQNCYTAAVKDKAVRYSRVVQMAQQLRGCLAAGYPFVFGFVCYPGLESPETATTGMLPMPGPREDPIGGHAVLGVGYDDSTRRFTIRNSWGEKWGDKGYFYMPYEYVQRSDLSDDFWTIRLMSK